jgi:hypothetical protein
MEKRKVKAKWIRSRGKEDAAESLNWMARWAS